MKEIAQSNWEKFVGEEFEESMQGHLLSYPIQVDQDGTVSFQPLFVCSQPRWIRVWWKSLKLKHYSWEGGAGQFTQFTQFFVTPRYLLWKVSSASRTALLQFSAPSPAYSWRNSLRDDRADYSFKFYGRLYWSDHNFELAFTIYDLIFL